jgi:heme ABC exporter ATP-binding subunit CcmA
MSAHTLPDTAPGQPQHVEIASPLALVAARLEKEYDARPVLRCVNFTLAAGRTLTLLGPNGAGKTTLLRILATLTKPSSGEVAVAGLDVRREANAVRRVVGYVGHQPLLYDELTAEENLRFFAKMYGLRDGKRRAAEALALVGLRAQAREQVRTLSRGQTQRLALARGILHAPPVLLLDEPDTGLDEQALELLDYLICERRAAGQTTVLTTHALARGLALADDALVLAGGRVANVGLSAALTVEAVRDLCMRPAIRRGGGA